MRRAILLARRLETAYPNLYSDAEASTRVRRRRLEPWRVYKIDHARAFLTETGIDVDLVAPQIEGRFASAFVRARKPERKSCSGPSAVPDRTYPRRTRVEAFLVNKGSRDVFRGPRHICSR